MKIKDKIYPDGSDTRNPEKVAPTSMRLKEAMELRQKKQIDLVNETGIDKGSISHYLSGRYEPKKEAISKLANFLNVSEMWLWGYDVPMEKSTRPFGDEEEEISPHELQLTEGEKALIELFRRVPEDQQKLVLGMIRAALCTDK